MTAIDPTSRTVTTSLGAPHLRPSRRCAGQQGGQARHPRSRRSSDSTSIPTTVRWRCSGTWPPWPAARISRLQPLPSSSAPGLTGIETACELPARLERYFGDVRPRHGRRPQPTRGLGHGRVGAAGDRGALSADRGAESARGAASSRSTRAERHCRPGKCWHASTVVWCAGMRANPLTADLGVARDRLGRLPVDDYLRVAGVHDVFAAGDVAAARMDDTHMSVMSCQHGRPMGRFAGYNVVSDLLGEPMLELRIPWYVTVLDLGTGRCGLHRGLGSASRRDRGRSKSDQATPSTRANLSTAQRKPRCNTGRRHTDAAVTAEPLAERPVRHQRVRRNGAELARLEVVHRLNQFGLGVHHERAVLEDGFANRLAAENQDLECRPA